MSKLVLPLYILITSAALVVLKWGSERGGAAVDSMGGKLHFNINRYIITGVVLYGISFVLYTYLIAKYDLGYIIPVAAAFVYIAVFAASFFIFDEVFTSLKIAGIVLIVAGLTLLNFNK